MKYLILTDKVSGITCFYKTKNELEEKYLFRAVTLVETTRLRVFPLSQIKDTKLMQELESVADVFAFVSAVALDRLH